MSEKERDRLKLLPYVLSGELTAVRAAELLSLSERQVRRVLRRYELEGDHGLVHRSRGGESKRKYPEALCQRKIEMSGFAQNENVRLNGRGGVPRLPLSLGFRRGRGLAERSGVRPPLRKPELPPAVPTASSAGYQ